MVMVTEDNRTGLPVSLGKLDTLLCYSMLMLHKSVISLNLMSCVGAAASIIILAAVLVCLTILAMSFMRYRT